MSAEIRGKLKILFGWVIAVLHRPKLRDAFSAGVLGSLVAGRIRGYGNPAGGLGIEDSLAMVSLVSLGFYGLLVALRRIFAIELESNSLKLNEGTDSLGTRTDEFLIRCIHNCQRIASLHELKSRVFLLLGAIVSVLGLAVYIASVAFAPNAPLDRIIDEYERIPKMIALKDSRQESFDAKSPDGVTRPLSDLASAIREQNEIINKLPERLLAVRASIDWRGDILPLIRLTVAFLFLEVFAGILFRISQQNEQQATLWRAHQQVYERMIVLPSIARVIREHGVSESVAAPDEATGTPVG